MEYRCFDAPGRAQVVSIEWEKVIEDDGCSDRPDERDECFWPSHDPESAGYVERENFEKEQRKAQERMRRFEAGEWNYVGVIARAHVRVPIGQGAFVGYSLDSPGIWGIESDAGDYLQATFEEQKAELWAHLKTLAAFVIENEKAPD